MSKLDLNTKMIILPITFFCVLLPSFVSFVTRETKESQYLKTERDLEIA